MNFKHFSSTTAIVVIAAMWHSPALAQLSIPDRVAQNTCWYMSKGQPVASALQFALNPIMLLLDERNITPGYVVQNGQIISRGMDSYKESVGFYTFKKQVSRGVIRRCKNRLSTQEYNELGIINERPLQRRPEEVRNS